MQSGRWDEAESFISADSREYFHRVPKGPFLGFQIGAVKLSANGQAADVDLTMQIFTSNPAAPGPINVPQKSHWRRVEGVWYMVVPAPANQGTQSATLLGKTERQAPKPEELKFKGHRYILGTVQPDQVKTARFPFTNVTDHTVTLSSVNTFCDCLQVKTEKNEFRPGESGELDIAFDPKGFEREYMQTIVVKTDPGDLTTHLTVAAFVLPPELHMVPRDGHVLRKARPGNKPTLSAAPGGAQ